MIRAGLRAGHREDHELRRQRHATLGPHGECATIAPGANPLSGGTGATDDWKRFPQPRDSVNHAATASGGRATRSASAIVRSGPDGAPYSA